MRIAVIGATGMIGSRIVAEALHRGHEVTAVVRDRSKVADPGNGRPHVAQADVLNAEQVAAVARGHDILVSAIGAGDDAPAHTALIRPAAESLVAAMTTLGSEAPLLITIGGVGSLTAPDGNKVWDAETLPAHLVEIMRAHGDALDFLKDTGDAIRWVNATPSATIEPGPRTGDFRIAREELLVDIGGESHIGAEDFAIAVLNEAESPEHVGQRFTAGY